MINLTFHKTTFGRISSLLIVMSIFLGVAVAIDFLIALVLLVALAGFWYVFLYIKRPWLGLIIVFLLKASLDNLSRDLIIVRGLNASGLMNILIITWGIIYITIFGSLNIKQFLRVRTVKPSLIFLAFCLLSLSYTLFIESGLRDWVRIASAFALMYLMIQGFSRWDEYRAQLVIIAILIGSIVPILSALFQTFSGQGYSVTLGFNRVYGTFSHPNGLAFFLGQVSLYGFAGVFFSKRRLNYVLYGSITIISVLTLILTFTRIAWGSFLFALLILSALRDLRLSIIIAVFAILIVFFVPEIRGRFTDLLDVQSIAELSTVWVLPGYTTASLFSNSLHFRVYIWTQTWPVFLKSPLWGHGWGSFNSLALEAAGIEEAAHNDYWRLLVETGIIGLMLYLNLVFSVWKTSIYLYRQLYLDNEVKIALAGFIASFPFYLVSQITDNVFEYQTVLWYIWGVAGLISAQASALNKIQAEQQKRNIW